MPKFAYILEGTSTGIDSKRLDKIVGGDHIGHNDLYYNIDQTEAELLITLQL